MAEINFPAAPLLNQLYPLNGVTWRHVGGGVWEPVGDGPVLGQVVDLLEAATINLNAAAGTTFRVTLTGNRTLAAPINPADGQEIVIEVTQDGTGSRTLTFTTGAGGFAYGTDVTGITLSTAAGRTDYIRARYSASRNRWHVIAVARGYTT